MEEVMAFMPFAKEFIDKASKLGYSIRVLVLDAKTWLRWSRPRSSRSALSQTMSLQCKNIFESVEIGFVFPHCSVAQWRTAVSC